MSFLSDVRFAQRLLYRAPLFSLTLLGVLVAGIGATTAMFSIAESLLLRPLPYERPEELTMVYKTFDPVSQTWPASYPDFKDWQTDNKSYRALAASTGRAFSLSQPGKSAVAVDGADVTGDFFDIFELKPLRGRFLGPDDDRAGAAPVCVISADLWKNQLGGDPNVIGTTLMLNTMPFTVIGIAPEGFHFRAPHQRSNVWVSLAKDFEDRQEQLGRGSNFMLVVGRRRAGVSKDAAQADMSAIAASLAARYPNEDSHRGINVVDLHEATVGGARESILVLFGAVTLLFLVVCANVASLLLARGATRRGEMAARAALGATRAQLVVQLVTESTVVFLLGGVGGAAIASLLVKSFGDAVLLHGETTNMTMQVDGVALAFAVGIALVCGIAFGLAPALATSRVEPYAVLKESAAQAGVNRSQRAIRGGLVVAQVAVAFALLVASGIALRTLKKTAEMPPGFDAENVVIAELALPGAKYNDRTKQQTFYETFLHRLGKIPGVESAGINCQMPMNDSNSNGWFAIEGKPPWPPNEGPMLERNTISNDYFKTLHIPILRGRAFNEKDRSDSRPVMIISEEAANRFFPGEDPVGKRIDLQDGPMGYREIVGVAGNVRRWSLAEPPAAESFVPIMQDEDRWIAVAVRASSIGPALSDEIRAAVTEVDSDIATQSIVPLQEIVDSTIARQRILALLLGAFAIAGLVLSTLGLFGLVSYSTSQRTRELGLRMALGSSPSAVVGLVVRGGAKLVGLGLAIGLVGALALGRTVAAHIAGAASFDPLVYGTIPVVLGLAGLLSCALPAWRAARIPPSSALRYE